jgi:hypothetical protein
MSGFVAQDERESTAPKQPANSSQQGGVEPARPIVQGAENAPLAEEISPKLEEAVQRGFEALRRMQKSDGSFGQGRFGEHVGITSLCAIALMADGNVPGRGEFGDCVQKALDFVLSHSTETGLLVSDDTHGPMYGHGFATLFLGEIYGMNQDDDRVRDALVRAVQLIVSSQNNEGGWRYNPIPADADVSVTICEIMALRSARNAGIKVPKSTIDDAIRYVRSCQNDDGGFRYMKEVSGSAWPRTAAGIASLFYAGIYEDQSIDRGLDYLTRNAFPRGAGGVGVGFSQQHYFYGHYYAVQAMYLAGGERWKNWWPAIREELIAKQNPDGTWTDRDGPHRAPNAEAIPPHLPTLKVSNARFDATIDPETYVLADEGVGLDVGSTFVAPPAATLQCARRNPGPPNPCCCRSVRVGKLHAVRGNAAGRGGPSGRCRRKTAGSGAGTDSRRHIRCS